MPVRVRELASGKTGEVSSAEARKGLGTQYELVDARVRVIGPDGRSATVPRDQVQKALGAGFKLADEGEVAEQKLRNDANTAAANFRGAAEQVASGLTLGGSDLALEALGADPAGMRAREEALGAVGGAARLVGEVAPALLTGGASAGARGAARFLPGVMLETAAARAGGSSLARRGAIEGFGYGVGAEIHESVLGETDLNAEHLLAGGFTSAALGGAAGGLMGGALRGGRGAVDGLGRAAREGSSKIVDGVEGVLARVSADGVPPSRAVAEAIAKNDGSRIRKLLELNGVPPAEATRISTEFIADPARFHTAMSQGKRLDDELAVLVRDKLNEVQSLTDDTLIAAEGAAKYRSIDKQIPAGAREQVLDRTADELYKIRDNLDKLAADNAVKGHQLYDVGKLSDAQSFVERATVELIEDPKAAHAFEVMDRLKRDLGTLKIFGQPPYGSPSGVGKANAELRKAYQTIRGHLEREDLWGAAAVQQRKVNEAATADFNAQAAFRGENGGGSLGRIWDPATREVNARTARRIAKQYGRSGPLAGEHLGDVLEARIRRLEAYAEHTELPEGVRGRIKQARAAKESLEAELRKRAELASIVDDMEVVRNIEGNRSVSIGAQSTIGPLIGGVVGSALGPLGTAAGILAGSATRPYTALRGTAAILSHLDNVTKRINVPLMRTRAKLMGESVRAAGRGAGRAARATGRGIRKVGTAAATHADDREKTMERVRQLVRNPDLLADALDVPTYDLRTHAPNLERIAAQKLLVQAQYLVSQEPPKTTTPFGETMVDPVKEREFAQCFEATMDPIGTLERIPEGLFTQKHAHAMQAVWPELWRGAQAHVAESFITAQGEKRKIPLDLRSGIGITLGVPTDAGLTPGMATELAMRYSGQIPGLAPPPAPGSPGGGRRPRKARAGDIKRTINTYRTPLERAGVD